ncbi:DUF2987 domain-containing protein [Shewanella sp. Isolate7]|uniref:DUF2987 domain-containing protein n=1 Tax=Shewanella sp. Isolate7 TaxID=2908528 RepID=UPI001EFD32F2|nr:DUF2987 domain-containing protein [Shewanella sp. Isolate7]MCG9722829.1 DUF2987 domain-containing protein [Shewanella sp. Isolate7]
MNKGLLCSCLLLATSVVQATPISLDYQGFYQRMKQMNKGNYSLIDIAFSVPKENGCLIESGSITTEKRNYPLTFSGDQRLYIPFDETLKSDRALINLQMKNDATRCGVAMQIRAKSPSNEYSQAALSELAMQMDQLLKQMQGFPMKYFADDIAGVSFEFAGKAQVVIDGKMQQVDGIYRLASDKINTLSKITFSETPKVISPWVKSS